MSDAKNRAVKALFGDKEDGPWNNERSWGERDGYAISVPALTRAIESAVAAERERCAKIALAHICTFGSMAEEIHATATAEAIAADIRAVGQ